MPKIKFRENPSSETKLFHADRQKDGRADTTKLTVGFRNFAKIS